MRVQKFNVKEFSLKLILVLLSVFAGLVLSEGIVRIFKLAPKVYSLNPALTKSSYKFSSNPVLGYEFRENYRDNGLPDLINSYPYINSHGHRDVERTYEKPEGVKRIILLGDSVACGATYIYNIQDTIPGQLENMLKERKMEVLNFGINGYCTRAEVELLKVKGIRYKPDLVILLFVDNDYDNMNNDLGMVPLPRQETVEKLFVSSYLFRYLCLKFNLFHMRERLGLNNLAERLVDSMSLTSIEKVKKSDDPSDTILKKHLNAVGDNNVENGLKLLKKLSEQYHFRILIGIWPTFGKDEIVDCETYDRTVMKYVIPDGQKLYIEKLADRYGIPVFRFSRYFRKNFNEMNRSGGGKYQAYKVFTGGDSVHPNKTGAAVAAGALQSVIDSDPALLSGKGR